MSEEKPAMVKVFNLTDVETPTLVQFGLVSQHIVIGERMCEPGQYVEVVDSAHLRATVKHLVQVSALAIDRLPPPYVQARQLKENASSKLSNVPAHLNVQETKVVDTAAQVPPEPQAAEPAEATEAQATSETRRKR